MLSLVAYGNTLNLFTPQIPLNNSCFQMEFNERKDQRVHLTLDLFIRRTINSPDYFCSVKTVNVSKHGAAFSCDYPLENGTELRIKGLKGQFWAQALVKHVQAQAQGGWLIGIELISTFGKWIIN